MARTNFAGQWDPMAEKAHPNRSGVRVNPVDRRGRPISPAVLNAAEEIGRRALLHAERQLIDPAVAANLLEEAAATVSRAMSAREMSQHPIRDLHSYLFRAFLRRVNKRLKHELFLAESLRIHTWEMPNSVDPRPSIDNKILIDEFLMQCDPTTRDMLWRRIVGFSWKEIGWSYRISSHAAESRFNQTFQKIRRRLGLR
jgi:DNA-directed RNA polymerase specialized sigma24 family protein